MRILFSFLLILLSCGVMAQEEPAAGDSEAEPKAQEEEQTGSESGGQEGKEVKQGDFKPSQEISEDYPVPLPADI